MNPLHFSLMNGEYEQEERGRDWTAWEGRALSCGFLEWPRSELAGFLWGGCELEGPLLASLYASQNGPVTKYTF